MLSYDDASVSNTPSDDADVDPAIASALLPPRSLLAFTPLAELTNQLLALFNFIR